MLALGSLDDGVAGMDGSWAWAWVWVWCLSFSGCFRLILLIGFPDVLIEDGRSSCTLQANPV